jgi:hypothetical protein
LIGRRHDESSGRKALAAASATSRDDATATDGFHAGAKAMAPLTHDLGGLISPFHVSYSISTDAACFATNLVEADIAIEKRKSGRGLEGRRDRHRQIAGSYRRKTRRKSIWMTPSRDGE